MMAGSTVLNFNQMKKEVIYTMPYETEEEIRKAGRKRERLYEKYNSVQVYPNGLSEVRIVATDKIKN
jgi:hypothetical protein